MSSAVNGENSVVHRIGDSDEVDENLHISAIPPRKIICSDILLPASDSDKFKIFLMAFLPSLRLIEKNKLIGNGKRS